MNLKSALLTLFFLGFTALNLGFGQGPNIILILADDQGWTGTSVQLDANETASASDFYRTPQLERFASEGMTFSRGYAPSPKCSPSRASILQGQSTATTGVTETGAIVLQDSFLIEPLTLSGVDANATTFVQVLKSLPTPYMTAHYGKWHLGNNPNPAGIGFDRSDGSTSNLASQGATVQADPKKIFSITDSALTFITDAAQAGSPFYVQLSHYAVHDPLESTQASLTYMGDTFLNPPGANHNDSTYGGMTRDLDFGVGQILDTLISLGLDSNTYVIYFSDNGAARASSTNAPLSRGKVYLTEGGLRVPLLIKGPGIAPGSRSDIPAVGYDLYPTILEWATGSQALTPPEVEGTNLAGILANGGTGPLNRSTDMVFHSPHYSEGSAKQPRSAIIRDDYKLTVNYHSGEFLLFDVESNLRENNNLRDTFPQITYTLCVALRDHLKDVGAQMPVLNSAHPANPGSTTDADADGLDDVWEFRELLTVFYDAQDDPDGDGLTNMQEFTGNTDPYVFDSLVSISPTQAAEPFVVYPNPGSDHIYIKGTIEYDQVEVIDLMGRRLMKIDRVEELNIKDLTPGRYFLRLYLKGKRVGNPSFWVDR